MLGTTSRVPNSHLHYLILDIDRSALSRRLGLIPCPMVFQRTNSGWHIYTSLQLPFDEMLTVAKTLGADQGWLNIAYLRGYAFLADYDEVPLPWPVERMIVSCGEKR